MRKSATEEVNVSALWYKAFSFAPWYNLNLVIPQTESTDASLCESSFVTKVSLAPSSCFIPVLNVEATRQTRHYDT